MCLKYYSFLLNRWVTEDRICRVSHTNHWGLLLVVSVSVLSRKLVSNLPWGVLFLNVLQFFNFIISFPINGVLVISWPCSPPPKPEMFLWSSAYLSISIFLWVHPHQCLVQIRDDLYSHLLNVGSHYRGHRDYDPFRWNEARRWTSGVQPVHSQLLLVCSVHWTKEELVWSRTTWDVYNVDIGFGELVSTAH